MGVGLSQGHVQQNEVPPFTAMIHHCQGAGVVGVFLGGACERERESVHACVCVCSMRLPKAQIL